MINVIFRAVKIIQCLSEGLNGLVEIADKVELSKSTVHHILKSLEASGMVLQNPTSRKYYLGPLIYKLSANTGMAHQGLVACGFEEMRYLRELTDESVAIQIRSGPQRLVLEELESKQSHRFTLGRDYMAPLYTGSGGIVMLAQLPILELNSFMANLEILLLGPGAIKTKDQLICEVKKARKKGYAVSCSTVHHGTAGISVPINNYICSAALSVFGPQNRLDKALKHTVEIKKCGERISNKIARIFQEPEEGRAQVEQAGY